MTLGMGWVRSVGETREFVVAVDSRLSGGQSWDCCPKLLLLPRSDCVLCFSGDTHDAYPLMLQIQNAINMYGKTRDRTVDVTQMRGHMMRVFKHMRTFVHELPRGQDEPPQADVRFIFGGYSWRHKDFRFWRIRGRGAGFEMESPDQWGPEDEKWRIHFIGDEAPIIEAKKKLARLLRSRGKLPEGDFDMEPFEVLRDIIREGQFRTVGGPPQLAKVYEHMNTVPFAIYWPDRETGEVSLLGRPLLPYEVPEWPILDPDDIQFRPPTLPFTAADTAASPEPDAVTGSVTPA